MTDAKGGGYQREQVDSYVSQLRQTYQQLYDAHAALQKQYDELQTRATATQQEFERDACIYRAQKDAIAQALIQAQFAANAMLTAARDEAEQLRRGLSPRQTYQPQTLAYPYPAYFDYSPR
ncbi:MAG: DivIVA domain-containing protein [Oscillospiraceae bacterium]|jgi:cell division septum initiation protein DivIVA|nr:DivIVA domain-containing protein [Oscillospiraceae bacterium]